MPETFITLQCRNCNGKLDVYEDMERFACGYCGTEVVVQRGGGTVALKIVTEAIRRVESGTEKTAAELAITRYEVDLNKLREKGMNYIATRNPKATHAHAQLAAVARRTGVLFWKR